MFLRDLDPMEPKKDPVYGTAAEGVEAATIR
jgi:hypothetical protein